jgi:uncharacterized SAM-binding protein YcdF (DUF218 family)
VTVRRALGWVGGAVAATIAAGEIATWRVSRRAPAMLPDDDGPCAIVVLGYPTRRDGRASAVQRWRTTIGVRTLGRVDDGWLIFSGGRSRDAAESEAAVMARYAHEVLGVPGERIRLEEQSRSTWDNVACCLRLAEAGGAARIAIASDPFHAEKARRYVRRQRPDLAPRLVRAADYRLLERWWLKPPTVAYFLWLRSTTLS